MRTIKTVLAVSALLDEKGASDISVNAIISKNEYRFPPSIAEANHITTLQTNNILAKMIAHSCTQTGLSQTFREVFDFEGSEFYLITIPEISGLSFRDLMNRVSMATPVGIYHDNRVIINPDMNTILEDTDKVLVFAEEKDSAKLEDSVPVRKMKGKAQQLDVETYTETVIIGHNETLPIILQELPESVSRVYLDGREISQNERKQLDKVASKRHLKVEYFDDDLHSEEVLLGLAKKAKHIVILSDHDEDPEEDDMETIFLLLHLRDIRKRFHLDFNITVEMQQEHNQKLVGRGDHTDFLVTSSMSSLILVQLAESPEIIDVFKEILSNEGNELYLKNANLIHLTGDYSIRELRMILLKHEYIFLGYIDSLKNSYFNLPLDEVITLTKDDNIIVLGKK